MRCYALRCNLAGGRRWADCSCLCVGPFPFRRQKGDPSRKRDFLPDDKQYLISRNGEPTPLKLGQTLVADTPATDALDAPFDPPPPPFAVPCFRRANAVSYTDEDEDGERLLNFLDDVSHLLPFPGANFRGSLPDRLSCLACRLKKPLDLMASGVQMRMEKRTGWRRTSGGVSIEDSSSR